MTVTTKGAQPTDARLVASVLAEIADLASETIELQDVFDRVATSVRRVIPFHSMTVVRLLDGDCVELHATTSPGASAKSRELPLTAWSPRSRPGPGPRWRIDDAGAELDPDFPMDAEVLKGGLGSGLWEPFRREDAFAGGIWVSAHETHAFTEEHQDVLRPIAALLGSAVEHWRIWDTERRRTERLDQLERLLSSLAESLDVREVFQRLSAAILPILPHDLVNLTELDLRARTTRIIASAGPGNIPVRMDTFTLTEDEIEDRADFGIIRDILAELAPQTERHRLIRASGLRSWLHVPVLLSGEVEGSLSFLHREPGRYGRDDAEVARRVADRVALTISHQQLAERARIVAESRQRAERLEARVETLARDLETRERSRVIGISRPWMETLRDVGRVASSETTVLITGESGTGKEVISGLIHRGSSRVDRPFVAINCAALPEQLLESELFGHEKGAFTGAIATKIGRVEQAEGGTLFLDEIAEMSPMVQAKLLRVLEEREYQRVGGTRTIAADVRVIAATNRDLAASIARQTFREDLYYRLNVFQIHIAPLRQRPEDIVPLAEAFLEDLGRRMGRPAAGISREARDGLLRYAWPGNVRELRNAIERAILLCDGGTIEPAHLPSTAPPRPHPPFPIAGDPPAHSTTPPANAMNVEDMERGLIEKALAQSRGNKSKAAQLLGLSRAQLYWRMEKYDIP